MFSYKFDQNDTITAIDERWRRQTNTLNKLPIGIYIRHSSLCMVLHIGLIILFYMRSHRLCCCCYCCCHLCFVIWPPQPWHAVKNTIFLFLPLSLSIKWYLNRFIICGYKSIYMICSFFLFRKKEEEQDGLWTAFTRFSYFDLSKTDAL